MRGIATRVASSDALAKLSDEVRGLAEKMDQAGGRIGDSILSALDARLAGLADALETRNRNGRNSSPEFEGLVKALIDKIERGQFVRDGHSALARLEELIAELADKLDACDTRLDHLEAIEHGLRRNSISNTNASRTSLAVRTRRRHWRSTRSRVTSPTSGRRKSRPESRSRWFTAR